MRDLRVVMFVGLASLSLALAAETGGETIDLIQQRGVLNCWLSASKSDQSQEIALCEAIAGLIIGDPQRVNSPIADNSVLPSLVIKREADLAVTRGLVDPQDSLEGLVLVGAYTMDGLPIVAIMDENDQILSKLVTEAVESLISEGLLCREKEGCPEKFAEPEVKQEVEPEVKQEVKQEVEPVVKESTGSTLEEVRGAFSNLNNEALAGAAIVLGLVFWFAMRRRAGTQADSSNKVDTRDQESTGDAGDSPEDLTFAEIGVTDAAISDPIDDVIGTSYLAKGISLFLCHGRTKAPLTIAITGEWGSGKSSVMGMLKKYLADARYCPVWFNAWHHRGEAHLFGSLLENIRKDAVPRIWHLSGIVFRSRLLWFRLLDQPGLFTIIGAMLILAMFPEEMGAVFSLGETWTTKLRIGGGVVAAIALLDRFSAFGMSSKEVLKGVLSSFKTVDFDTDTGLRYRVRTCLEHIDKALGPRTLVIFVDDLDRCPAAQVLKVLEVVNFLSASPVKSFVIFGVSLEIGCR